MLLASQGGGFCWVDFSFKFLQQGFASVILIVYCYSCYSEVPGVSVCLVFSCALILEKCEALLMLYESMLFLP